MNGYRFTDAVIGHYKTSFPRYYETRFFARELARELHEQNLYHGKLSDDDAKIFAAAQKMETLLGKKEMLSADEECELAECKIVLGRDPVGEI